MAFSWGKKADVARFHRSILHIWAFHRPILPLLDLLSHFFFLSKTNFLTGERRRWRRRVWKPERTHGDSTALLRARFLRCVPTVLIGATFSSMPCCVSTWFGYVKMPRADRVEFSGLDSLFVCTYQLNLSVIQQCFSLITNQPTVLFATTYQPNEHLDNGS